LTMFRSSCLTSARMERGTESKKRNFGERAKDMVNRKYTAEKERERRENRWSRLGRRLSQLFAFILISIRDHRIYDQEMRGVVHSFL
jgi:hypothetical protein